MARQSYFEAHGRWKSRLFAQRPVHPVHGFFLSPCCKMAKGEPGRKVIAQRIERAQPDRALECVRPGWSSSTLRSQVIE